MPFEQKYTPETREKSLARVLERRASEPGNRSIIRETADEFQVGEQSLRGWIRAWEKANSPVSAAPEEPTPAAVAEPVSAEPEPVVAEPATLPAPAAAPVAAPAAAPVRRGPGRPSAAAISDGRVAELEAEVQKLRRDREALKSALAVLLSE